MLAIRGVTIYKQASKPTAPAERRTKMAYQDDDQMLDRIMKEAAPGSASASMREFNVRGPDATGRFAAVVTQRTWTPAGSEETVLESKMFTNERGASRWLNTQRVF
jgi:hypothetical protein